MACGDAAATDSTHAPASVVPLAVPAPSAAQPSRRSPLLRFASPTASVECKVKSPAYEGRAPLRAVRRAIMQNRAVRVIALGSSSTVGIGSTSPRAPIQSVWRTTSKASSKGSRWRCSRAAKRVRWPKARRSASRPRWQIKPDLVVWQVGTNDAVARIDAETFGQELRDTLSWLASHQIDVVLIDPQYRASVKGRALHQHCQRDCHRRQRERVLLVNRYDTMADLARQHPGSSYLANDRFHLNDLGYRCMAEYAAKAITAGILQADVENGAMH